MPFISVVTVVFNAADTLEQTIQSVLSQSFRDFEYLIIDGGSTDGTLEIIKKYESHLSFWVSEKDNGLYDAMNKGVVRCSGAYIAMLNADDWYEKEVFQHVFDSSLKYGMPEVISGGIQFWKEGEKDKVSFSDLHGLKKKMTVYHPTCFIHRKAYKKVGNYSLSYKLASDYDLLLRILMAGGEFVAEEKVFSNMRVSGLSEKKWKQALEESRKIKLKYFPLLKVNLQFYEMFLKDSLVRTVHSLGLAGIYRKYKNLKSKLTGEKTFYSK